MRIKEKPMEIRLNTIITRHLFLLFVRKLRFTDIDSEHRVYWVEYFIWVKLTEHDS